MFSVQVCMVVREWPGLISKGVDAALENLGSFGKVSQECHGFCGFAAVLLGLCSVEWIFFDAPCSLVGEDSTAPKYLLLECCLSLLCESVEF